jgi:hypothetical protein
MRNGLNLFDTNYYTRERIRALLKEKIVQAPGLEFLIEEFCKKNPVNIIF